MITLGVNSPLYIVVQQLSLLKGIIQLIYTNNLQISKQLMWDIQDISMDDHTRLPSFDTLQMCTNISITETINITDKLMKENYNNTLIANQEVPCLLKEWY
jgi:hypothetical protein